MPVNIRMNYIELPAKDLAAVEKFYGGAFGWTFESYGPEYLAFNDGAMDGGFYKADKSSAQADGSTLLVLYADDLESCADVVVAAGGKITTPTFDYPGGRRFHFTDPAGNELAVWGPALAS